MAAPAVVRAASLMPISSRALAPLDPAAVFEEMARHLVKRIIYGNPNWEPMMFTGFAPYFHVIGPDELYDLGV